MLESHALDTFKVPRMETGRKVAFPEKCCHTLVREVGNGNQFTAPSLALPRDGSRQDVRIRMSDDAPGAIIPEFQYKSETVGADFQLLQIAAHLEEVEAGAQD